MDALPQSNNDLDNHSSSKERIAMMNQNKRNELGNKNNKNNTIIEFSSSTTNHPQVPPLQQLQPTFSKSTLLTFVKLSVSIVLLYSSFNTQIFHRYSQQRKDDGEDLSLLQSRRRLSSVSSTSSSSSVPTYMNDLMEDLTARKKLFDETPPEEVKYWFEYTAPLQRYYYHYSKERQKADSFEGRDDSGVVSARFSPVGGGDEHHAFYNHVQSDFQAVPTVELNAHHRLLDNCFALGNGNRPDLSPGSPWQMWFSSSSTTEVKDRCRVLVTLNTIGSGRRDKLLWETNPPKPPHAAGPTPWISEQESAAPHLERNLREMDAMCKTGFVAVRLQVLVCEPIPGVWTDWMDSMLPHCGGNRLYSKDQTTATNEENRPSPLQVVVIASSTNADQCHDLKSGYVEKRMQDLILAPPYTNNDSKKKKNVDPTIKTTHPDLISSEDYDLYIGMKWSSLVTLRSVTSFLQASADLAVAASSSHNQGGSQSTNAEDSSLTGPSSSFLIPSFVRVSYLSEENAKVAKWRMHGDFFHPAAWEICQDSFDVVWIPDSLSGNGGVNSVCAEENESVRNKKLSEGEDCGQWWMYVTEQQMSLAPEVYANEKVEPLVNGGSNFIWMLTERHRREIVTQKTCEYDLKKGEKKENCGETPQAVMPLGDEESFLINFIPNTALGKKHLPKRSPGYSNQEQRDKDRQAVKDKKQLKDQEEIEKALFDYTVYPAALLRKDATLKAARTMDFVLSKGKKEEDSVGPVTIKSEYYDVSITKPRGPVLGWCMAIARRGLCTLYAEYFRQSEHGRCAEACGLRKHWSPMEKN